MRQDSDGSSLVVVRTEIGARLLEAASIAGVVARHAISLDDVLVSQKGMLSFKQNYEAFQAALRGAKPQQPAPVYRYGWEDGGPMPLALRWYARLAYFSNNKRNARRWMRILLVVVQALLARYIKRSVVQLTDHDHENYFF
jgi:hypothetical protein